MEKIMNRKQFFQKTLIQTARVSAEFAQNFIPPQSEKKKPTPYHFEADFPPELLAAEAKNMGLDPEDTETVLAAIAEKLQPLKT